SYDRFEIANGFRRDFFAVRDNRIRERAAAGACALGRQARHRTADDALREIHVLLEHIEHVLDVDVARGFVPAIVVGRQRDGPETYLRLARELRLLEIGHADHVGSPGAVKPRLRARGELRPLHAEIRPALMDAGALLARRARKRRAKLGANGIGETYVCDDAAAEKRAWPLRRAVDELIGDDDVARRDLLLQTADGADRDNALDTELFHREDIGAEVDFGGQRNVAAAMPGQKNDARAVERSRDEDIGRTAERRGHADFAD